MTRDDGSATVEFVLLAVVLLVPLVYVVLSVFALQRAAFAATAAAREAGRAYVVSDGNEPVARRAAAIALGDQLPGGVPTTVSLAPRPGAVAVEVTVVVELPLAGRWARVPVVATHVATLERYG